MRLPHTCTYALSAIAHCVYRLHESARCLLAKAKVLVYHPKILSKCVLSVHTKMLDGKSQ